MLSKISHILDTKRIEDVYIQTKDLRINLDFELIADSVYSFDNKNQIHFSNRHNAITIKESKIIDCSYQNNLLFIIVKGL